MGASVSKQSEHQMGFSRAKRVKALEDRISELPDEILSFTLSFLPVREAARTSILSCRWRYVWTTSRSFCSSLSLDALNMRGSDYPKGMLGDVDEKYMYKDNTSLLKIERSKFIEWINKMMQLDYLPVLDSFRLRYHLRKKYAGHIDHFLKRAIKMGAQKIDINLSRFYKHDTYPNTKFYTFPDGLFTEETGIQVKSLWLKSCIFGPFNCNCFASLSDLQLDNVLLDQDRFHSFLLSCPSVENLCLTNCSGLYKFKVSGPHIQLKSLALLDCDGMIEIEIVANYLARFEYRGRRITFRVLKVPRLLRVTFCVLASNHSPMVESISSEIPNLESLLLSFGPHKEYIVPNNQFANLKNLEVIQHLFRESLWQYIPLIHSAPYLSSLEFNWNFFPPFESEMDPEPKAFDSPHRHLKKMTLTGFGASDHEFEFVRYMLNNTAALEEIAISFNYKGYSYECGYEFCERSEKKKPDENKVRQQIMNLLPLGVKFLIF
ncbi:hypothetical protein ACHQM5_029869 [Ranunculus cassubicifolius]